MLFGITAMIAFMTILKTGWYIAIPEHMVEVYKDCQEKGSQQDLFVVEKCTTCTFTCKMEHCEP